MDDDAGVFAAGFDNDRAVTLYRGGDGTRIDNQRRARQDRSARNRRSVRQQVVWAYRHNCPGLERG